MIRTPNTGPDQTGPMRWSRRTFVRNSIVCAAVTPFAAFSGCRKQHAPDEAPPRVVMYVSVDDVLARSVLKRCTLETGIEIDAVFDTEATKTTGLENRIRAERGRSRADLFWSSEAFATARLAADGLLVPLPPELLASWPSAYRDIHGRWIAFAARARVIVTNPRRTTVAVTSWSQLADPSLRDAGVPGIAIADPRFGTTRGHLAALDDAWSRARSEGRNAPTLEAWLDGLRSNGVRVLPGGNGATVEAVATGECAYGMTDTDDALAAQARGFSLSMVVPRTMTDSAPGYGTMIVPNTLGLVAGRDVSNSTLRVARWLVSPTCEQMLCESPLRNRALGPEANALGCTAAFDEPDPLQFDLAIVAGRAAEIASRAHAILTRGGIPAGGAA